MLYKTEAGGTVKLIVVSGTGHLFLEARMACRVLSERLLVSTGKLQIDWFKTLFLGEVNIALRLGIKCWFADLGLSTGDSIFGPVVSFFNMGKWRNQDFRTLASHLS